MYDEKEEKSKNKEKKKGFFRVEDNGDGKSLILEADWVSIAIKLGLLLIFSFLIIFIFTKFNNRGKKDLLKDNVQVMRTAAYTYFKEEENRPTEDKEEIYLSLQEMMDYDLVDELKDEKKQECNPLESYAGLTKLDETKYDLDIYLDCDEEVTKANYTLHYNSEKETEVEEENNDTKETVDTKEENKEEVEEEKPVVKEEPKKEETTKPSTSVVENKEWIYEQKKTTVIDPVYTCNEGYTLDGEYCYSEETVETVTATPLYKDSEEKVTTAFKNRDTVDYEYVNPIATTDKDTMKCINGYDLVGNKCQRIIDASTNKKTTYYCKSGTLNGKKCEETVSGLTTKTTYECKTGKLVDTNRCYLTVDTKTRCKYGTYDKEKDKCYTVVSAIKKYTGWSYQGMTNLKANDSSETKKYVKYKLSNKNYTYKVYTRKIYYSCMIGEYDKDGKCRDYDDLYEEVYCPSGYKLTNDKKACYKYVKATAKKTNVIECPSGYKKVNNKCVKSVGATMKVSLSYTCPSGYTLYNKDKCIKQMDATVVKGKTHYSCPNGYSSSGSGSNMKCYKKITTPGGYYCKDENAVLKDDKCVIAATHEFKGYTCPKGYELSGTTCYKYVKSKKEKAILVTEGKTSTEYMWSKDKYVDGWTYTGKSKQV